MQIVTFECMFCFTDNYSGTFRRMSESWVSEYLIHVWVWSERTGRSKGSLAGQRALIRSRGKTGRSEDEMTRADWWDKSKHLKKKKWLWGWGTCFHFRLSQNASKSSFANLTLKSLLDHKNMKDTVSARIFEALQRGPLLLLPSLLAVITVVIAERWRIYPKGKQRKEEERGGRLCCSLSSVESLQLLEIKLQTGSFIPRRVQLILQLDFKEAAVLLCGAMPRPQLAAAAKPIKSPPTGHTGRPHSRN